MIMANPFSIVVAFGIQGYYSAKGFFPNVNDVSFGNESVLEGTNQIIIV